MAPNDPPSPSDKPGGGWRGGWRPAAGGRSPAAGRKGAGWAKREDRTYEHAVRRHRTKVAVWTLLLLILVGLFIWWLPGRPVRTPLLVATVTDYASPVPPNAWADEDAEQLGKLDEEEIVTLAAVSFESKDLGLSRLRAQLEKAAPGGPGKDVVIVYLSMHGLVDGRNEPCLLPPGASPLESNQWLRLADLLDYLFPKSGPHKVPDGVKKLLVLDCNRMDANWQMGLLYNAFAERLAAVVDGAGVPNLVVLNSTGPGQIGYAAPELQNSVFGYFFRQGLEGAADAEQPGNSDGRVSLAELHVYLKAHVSQWVRERRADVQEPMLIPPAADFPLVHAEAREKTTLPEPPDGDDPRWKDVFALWNGHAELKEKKPYRLNPLDWAEFQHGLLRLEELIQAGKAYENEFDELASDVASLGGELTKVSDQKQLAGLSPSLTRRLGLHPDKEEQSVKKAQPSEPSEEPPTAEGSDPKTSAEKGKEESAKEAEGETPTPPDGASETETVQSTPDATPEAKTDKETVPKETEPEAKPNKNAPAESYFGKMLDRHLDPVVEQTRSDLIRLALVSRAAGEHAAAPEDPRAHYRIQGIVDRADQKRRSGEDRLFEGDADALAEARHLLSDVLTNARTMTDSVPMTGVDDDYLAAGEVAEKIAEVFQTRDRACAKIPRFSQWLLMRLHEGDSARLNELRPLVPNVYESAAELDRYIENGAWNPDVQKRSETIAEELDAFREAFDQRCADLGPAGGDQRKLRDISSVLSLPLVTGRARNALRENYLDIARQGAAGGSGYGVGLADDAKAKGQEPGTADAKDADSGMGYLDRLAKWGEHPALMILKRPNNDGDQKETASSFPEAEAKPKDRTPQWEREMLLKRLARQGEQLRRLLREVRPEADRWMAKTTAILTSGEASHESPTATRAGYAKADRLVRAAAPMVARRLWKRPEDAPARRLRDLDLHYFLIWHARRTIDDFWGPVQEGDEPYFSIVAKQYLDAAKDFCRDDVALWEGKDPVSRLLAVRREAARVGIRPQKPKEVFVDEKDQSIKHEFSVTLADDLPVGQAAIYLRDREGKRLLPLREDEPPDAPELRRMPVAVTGEAGTAASPAYWIPVDQRLQQTQTLQAVALYRGHVWTADFPVSPVEGWDIFHYPPEYAKPKVTVYGQARRRRSVVFVLDCSGSMGEHLDPKEKTSPRRIDEARNALKVILARLEHLNGLAPVNPPFHVGVMVYGHRSYWKEDVKSRFFNVAPHKNIHPAEDVDWLLRPGGFGQSDRRKVGDDLDSLRTLGVTPLYLAIRRAIDEGRTEDDRHIVVITDGLNNQRGHVDPPEEAVTDVGHVQEALRLPGNQNIRLDVLGFGLIARDEEERTGLAALTKLATDTGGNFHSVANLATLRARLEKSLELMQYEIQAAESGATVAGPVELGETCVIDQATDRKLAYVATLPDRAQPVKTAFELAGGEWLKIYLEGDPRLREHRLVHRRFEEGLREFRDKVPDPLDRAGRSFFIATHLPDWHDGAARFYVSVQNSDPAGFSPRPAEVWVRIEPDPPSAIPGAPAVYSFYDVAYVANCPVPVLSCLAPKWPTDAKKAKVQLWCKLEKTRPDAMPTVRQLRQQPPRLADVPGVQFEVQTRRGDDASEPYQVMITERHPADADLYTVKVEMLPAAKTVKHRYNPKTGTVRHTFYYDDSAASQIDEYRVLLTSRKRLMDQAIALPEPLEVVLPRN